MEKNRYKRRGAQFTSATNSRALRAVQYKEGQRQRRGDAISHRRQIANISRYDDSLQDISLGIDTPGPSGGTLKKSKQELGIQRYQEFLKWREEKRKRLEKEKKKRQPAFRTGVFEPDKAKYLVSDDEESLGKSMTQTPAKRTPFKFLVSSSKKSLATPGTFVCKVPKFHTGVTPVILQHKGKIAVNTLNSSSQKNTLNSSSQKNTLNSSSQKENRNNRVLQQRAFTRSRAKTVKESVQEEIEQRRRNRARVRRPAKTQDSYDLGVQPLPTTPLPSQRPLFHPRIEDKPQPQQTLASFAPANFKFDYLVTKRQEENDFTKDDSLLASSTAKGNFSFTSDTEDEKISSEAKTEDNPEIENDEIEGILERDPQESDMKGSKDNDHDMDEYGGEDVFVQEESKSSDKEEYGENVKTDVRGHYEDTGKQYTSTESTMQVLGNPAVDSEVISIREDVNDNTEEVNDIKNESLAHCESGVRKRRPSRRSVACCEVVTPVSMKLRPRTPCSRSTRRSLNAHCDMEPLQTPGRRSSTRKSSRRSRSIASKIKEECIDMKLPQMLEQQFEDQETENQVTDELEARDCNVEVHGATPIATKEKSEEKEASVNGSHDIKRKSIPQSPTTSISPTTPSSKRHFRVSWMVRESPNIETRRGKRGSVPPDIKNLFDDIPNDGSPVPPPHLAHLCHGDPVGASPSLSARKTTEEEDGSMNLEKNEASSNILALLKPSSPTAYEESPGIDVWGENSPALENATSGSFYHTPVSSRKVSAKSPHVLKTSITASSTEDTDTLTPLPGIVINGAEESNKNNKSEKRKSSNARARQSRSVMFVVEEEEEEAQNFRFPGTPLRTSSKVSMGLYSNVDINTDALSLPNDSLMVIDSPKSEKKTTATRRSNRVSLLPHITLSPTGIQEVSETNDLISWETPMEPLSRKRTRRSSVASMATPSRRSRRLSKPVL